MSLYLVPSCAASSSAGAGEVPVGGAVMVAVRVADLVSPAGRPLGEGDRSALAVAGRSGSGLVTRWFS